jgi:CheY-like chemotaxis protein
LLVEDDQNEQALLRTLLEMEGYRVHTASNGNEALQCLEQITPQFVLLDMMMPECDGPTTLERMRAIPNFGDLPIFAVSGTSPESVGLSIGTDGVSDWFPKPLNAPRLVRHMRERIASLCS